MNATATIDLQATAELVWERVVAWELQPLWMRDAADVRVLTSHRAGPGVRVAVRTRVAGVPAFTDPLEEGRAAQVHPGREVGLAQVGLDEGVERWIELHETLDGPNPVVDAVPIPVVLRRVAEPVALAVRPPILARDVVLDDPSVLCARSLHPDRHGNPKTGDIAPLWLVPPARCHRGRSRALRGRNGSLARVERPVQSCRRPTLEGTIVVKPAQRIAQNGPCTVED